ncbi:hypothetical protein [Globicatella sulfidifaciens]|uniref:Lipoprotein n=1 Tax=Globicatella sulfidifaciens TaxID=136093 RepID=A0A7X8H0T5_9LACT|nr:hypothetical protein [Globicatella sulfidifaciens]NLJ19063.1 hypothetical protein [Globicatella sulfidifaciens]
MKKKFLLLLITVAMAVSIVGCDKSSESSSQAETSPSSTTEQSARLGTFDIEVVRKNIIIKGQPFEIPVALKDLPEGWTYDVFDEKDVYLDEGLSLADMYYNGEEMFIAALENYYPDKVDDSIIYNLTIYTEDCSIDGLMPIKSTKQDVVAKYGEPIKISNSGSYYYGIVNDSETLGGRINDHSICVKLDENQIIKSISITYADLTKEKY